MRRRAFIAGAGCAAAWPCVGDAQTPRKPPTVGFLGVDAVSWAPSVTAFVERLRQLGWVAGRTVNLESRWDEGRADLDAQIAAEFIDLGVDVIVTSGTPALALKQKTSKIPVVFAFANDPVGVGLVASLARPGGNITGLSVQAGDLAGKRLELLRESIPNFRRAAIIADASDRVAALELEELRIAAGKLNVELVLSDIRATDRIEQSLGDMETRADALYVVSTQRVIVARARILALALARRLPTMFNNRDYTAAGGLMSYGPNLQAMFRRSAELVDKILRGTKPGEIPVEQPTKFELVINLKTAKAIGLAIPESFLWRADEVIE